MPYPQIAWEESFLVFTQLVLETARQERRAPISARISLHGAKRATKGRQS
jgi:hypothetical protein